MARAAKAAKTIEPAAQDPKTGREKHQIAASQVKSSRTQPAPKQIASVAVSPSPPPPKLSNDELRAQVEKLERTVTTLRAKNREANKVARTATARIIQLESHVAGSEKLAPEAARTRATTRSPKPASVKRKSHNVDQGQSEQAGAAVGEPTTAEAEAETSA